MAKPKGGKRLGAGNPGYGKVMAVRAGVEKLTPRWFEMIEGMLDGEKDDRRFALMELGKLMGKMMPIEVTGRDGEPLTVKVVSYTDGNNSPLQIHAPPISASDS